MKTTAMLIEDGIFALFSRPHRGAFGSLSFPTPGNLPYNAKKLLMPVGLPGGHGRTWNRPPLVGDRDLFLGWRFYNFPVFETGIEAFFKVMYVI